MAFSLRSLWPFGKQKDGTYFYPFNGTGVRMIGVSGYEWINTEEPYIALDDIPQLRTVVNKKALMHANVCYKVVDTETNEEFVIDELYRVLENPNPLQGQNDFIKQRVLQRSIYGNQFVYKNRAIKSALYPSQLWNISPRYMAAYLSGNVFDMTKIEDIITKYVYNDGKTMREYKTNEILYTRYEDLDNPIIGKCPLVSISKPLSNILAAMKFQNRALTNMGAYGMISGDSGNSGGMGTIPLVEDEKKRITEDYLEKFGAGDNQSMIFLTEAALKYTPMGYPVKQMMIFETIDSNTLLICDNYGMDIKIFSNTGTKFDDLKQAMIKTYQDTIQPEVDADCQLWTKFLLPETLQGKYKIVGTFDHVPILKTDRAQGIQGLQQMTTAISQLVESGVITKPQASALITNEIESLSMS